MDNYVEQEIPAPNVRHFFLRFEKLAEHRNVEEDEILEWLGLLLERDALEQYDVIVARENPQGAEGYQNVKENIVERFENEVSKMAIWAKLTNRKTGEDVTQY